MKQPLNVFRLLIEIILAIAIAEAGVMFLLPVVAPGVEGTLEALLDASMLSVLSGPVILWRVLAAVKRMNAAPSAIVPQTRTTSATITAIVFGMGIAITVVTAIRANKEVNDEAKERFEHLTDRLVSDAQRRVNRATYGLMGARGIFAASPSVNRAGFRSYVATRRLKAEFPGVLGYGVIARVPRSHLDDFVAAERADGAPDFSVWSLAEPGSPLAESSDLYVIKYCFPEDRNNKAWGLDIGSELVRRQAVERAVETGEPTITGKVTLVQDGRKQAGFLYYLAVYKDGANPVTPQEHRDSLEAIVYAPIILDEAMANITDTTEHEIDFEIFDGEAASKQTQLFDFDGHLDHITGNIDREQFHDRMYMAKTTQVVGGRTWTFITSTTPKFEAGIDRTTPISIACAGLIVTLLATSFSFMLLTSRSRAVAYASCVTADLVSAKTDVERALRETQVLLATLHAHSIVSVADANGLITDVNEEFCRISGYTREELLGQDHRVVSSGRYSKEFWRGVWAKLKSGEPWHGEICNKAKDGSLYWVDSIIAPFMGLDGKVEKYVSIRFDITERKKTESSLITATQRAEDANRAKSAFLANMSHEIRTPLTAILGFADLLREEREVYENSDRRNQTVDTIRGAGSHLMTVINDILDLSKIEADKMSIERIETPLAGIIHEAQSMMYARAVGKGIGLNAKLATPIPERIWSDPTRLRQILMNIVGNAIKFTEAGAVSIVASVVPNDAGDRLIIDIEDTGPGMTAEQSERLFQAFAQADETVTRRHGGTGLGLTICRRLAALMGGSVVLLRTEPGKGSCFRIDLPLNRISDSSNIDHLDVIRHDSRVIVSADHIRLNGRILLAEDGPDNQKLIGFHLRKGGAAVEIADNGEIALRMIEQAIASGTPFDLLITDVQMPEMDGHTLARTLRERGIGMPIIALTAHAMAEDREKSDQAGCDDYATKPIDKLALLTTCSKWLSMAAERKRAA